MKRFLIDAVFMFFVSTPFVMLVGIQPTLYLRICVLILVLMISLIMFTCGATYKQFQIDKIAFKNYQLEKLYNGK